MVGLIAGWVLMSPLLVVLVICCFVVVVMAITGFCGWISAVCRGDEDAVAKLAGAIITVLFFVGLFLVVSNWG